MSLTPQQKTTLKAAILAAGGAITEAFNAGANTEVRDLCNAPSSPPHLLWDRAASIDAIAAAVDVTKYTPSDTPTLADTPAQAALYLNRSQAILVKQAALAFYTQGRGTTLDASKLGVRVGLRDATIQVPAGANGALTAPGGASGVNVLTACTRVATFAEKVLSGPASPLGGVQGNTPGFEGQLETSDIDTL